MKGGNFRRQYGYGAARLAVSAPCHRDLRETLWCAFAASLREQDRAQRIRLVRTALFRSALIAVVVAALLRIPVPEPEIVEPPDMEWLAEAVVKPLPPPPPEPVVEPPPAPFVPPLPEPVVAHVEPEPKPQARPLPIVIEPVARPRPEITPVAMEPIKGPEPVASRPVLPRIEMRPESIRAEPVAVEQVRAAASPAFPEVAAPTRDSVQMALRSPRRAPRLLHGDLNPTPFDVPALGFPSEARDQQTRGVDSAPTGERVPRPSLSLALAAAKAPGGEVDGVALSSLPSCRSEAEEESLKRRVLATVEAQVECNSQAGIWTFLQVRNLNAFLMNVKRRPGRQQGNRCDELRLALQCLRPTELEEI